MYTFPFIGSKACTALVVAGILFGGPPAAQAESTNNNAPVLRGYPPVADPMTPIEVGSRQDVGKESFASKQGKKVSGALLSKVLGGSGSKSGRDKPRTRRDPTRKQNYIFAEHEGAGIEAGARARWTDDGLLISTRIEKSDDKGTFQTIFLEDGQGRRLYPSRIEVYKIWTEHSLTVSWSKTTTLDGQVVSQESGGWSDTWIEDGGTSNRASTGEELLYPAVWQQVGYDRAQAGVRQLGAFFDVTPEQLTSSEILAFFVHISRPEQDPVITEPFNWLITAGSEGQAQVALPDTPTTHVVDAGSEDHETRSDWGANSTAKPPCEEAVLRIEKAKNKHLARLDDPLSLLRAALAAAQRVGQATTALSLANAELAAEQAKLDALQQYLEAWDAWSEEQIEKRARARERSFGSRQPSWAKGSDDRSRKRHQKQSADLRAQAQAQQQKVQQAQQVASQA